jgi:hypothetical protein
MFKGRKHGGYGYQSDSRARVASRRGAKEDRNGRGLVREEVCTELTHSYVMF